MIAAAMVIGLLLLSRRWRRAIHTPQHLRVDVHVHIHYPDGPGEPLELPQPAADNVVLLRRQR